MQFEAIKSTIESKFSEAVIGENLDSTPQTLKINPEFIVPVCEYIHGQEQLYFDSLSCLTGIDCGVESGAMEVVYTLYSIPYDLHLMLSVVLDRAHPEVDSVTSIWKTADWHEREAYDLLGIHFKNHPDLRRILLPADWEGNPLKKDYEEQKVYHSIKVKY